MAKDNVIKIDDRQLKKWANHTKLKRPSQAIAIMRGVLNDQAFNTQKQAKKNTIPGMFHNRTSWIASSILVTKAQGKNTKKMYSETGAAKRWKRNPSRDFFGLRDQEQGRTIRKPNINTEWSRGGSFSKNVKPSLRRNKLGRVREINSFQQLRNHGLAGNKSAVYIKKLPGFKKGVYKFHGGMKRTKTGRKIKPVVMIQDLSHQSVKLKKKPWLTNARRKAVTQQTTFRSFKRNWQRYTK